MSSSKPSSKPSHAPRDEPSANEADRRFLTNRHRERRLRGGGQRKADAQAAWLWLVAGGLLMTGLALGPPRAFASGWPGAAPTPPASGGTHAAEPPTASPQPTPPPLRWDERWPRVRAWEYLATATSGALLAYVQFGTYRSRRPRWRGGVLFDDAVQDVLRLRSRPARERADRASDLFWGLTHLVPAVDAVVVALAVRRNLDVAWQLVALDAEALTLMAFASRAMHKTARRARPAYERCLEDRGYDRTCGASSAVAGFWSGHFAMTGAAAGLTCAHHAQLPLYGGGWADRLACAATISTATVTGLLRVMADRHYLSDSLIGGALGFLVGWGIPTWLHYRWKGSPGGGRGRERGPASRPRLIPVAERDGAGLALVGVF
ncbi:MAG: phosphatase PAP2 family protein [Proteobacteria bacterium]|nr:phosphatase PAP2 family protein [Pseudomonadota bacterium]